MRLGAHVPTSGGVHRAIDAAEELGCEAIQIFSRNQRQWSPKPLDPEDVDTYRRRARDAGLLDCAVSHTSYLINVAATDPSILRKSLDALEDEVRRGHALGLMGCVLHPGAHLGAGEEAGLVRAAESIRDVLARTQGLRTKILVENTAGQGTTLGWRLQHLEVLRKAVRSRRLGFCIDTCHLFAAGYDFRTPAGYASVFGELLERVTPEKLRAFHLNDSKHPCGSRRDRHEHIGEGEIGRRGFRHLVSDPRFRDHPGLLETPNGPADHGRNLAVLRKLQRRK